MFEQKKILAALAAALLLNACGGGGGDSTPTVAGGSVTNDATGGAAPSGNTSGTGGTGNTDSGTSTPAPSEPNNSGGTTDPGTTPPASGGGTTTPPTSGTDTPANPATDQQLQGYLAMVASQLVYIKADRSIYFPVTMEQFEGTTGMYDFASGSTGTGSAGQVPAPAVAPAAPLAAFGIRIDRYVQKVSPEQAVANQTVVGRIAFNLTEQAGSPGIGANEVAERMSFVIDKVELRSNANGELVTARVLEGAKMVVTGRNAAGAEVNDTIAVPTGSVRLLEMHHVLDHNGDQSSIVLLVDLETAFSQAGQKLTALQNIAGRFTLQATFSSVPLVRPAAPANESAPALTRRELVGQSITVGGEAPVTGGGVSGTAWLRMYPPAP